MRIHLRRFAYSNVFWKCRTVSPRVYTIAGVFLFASLYVVFSLLTSRKLAPVTRPNVTQSVAFSPSTPTAAQTLSSTTLFPPVQPKMSTIKFRLISYFDNPINFPAVPKSFNDDTVPYLNVTRFGTFNKTRRHRDLVILVPTLSRPYKSYLGQTIRSLFNKMEPIDAERAVILISINEISPDKTNFTYSMVNYLSREFSEAISNGIIEIISPPREFYMDFYQIPNVQDPDIMDTDERLRWRSKQVIDYAFMMSYAFTQRMTDRFLLLIEDDVEVTQEKFVTKMFEFADNIDKAQKSNLTLWYEFCPWGAIGKMFPIKQIPSFVNVMTTIFYIEPVDWQLGHIAELFACRYYHSKEQCGKRRKSLFHVYSNKLFKHIAKVSTAPKQPPRKIPGQH